VTVAYLGTRSATHRRGAPVTDKGVKALMRNLIVVAAFLPFLISACGGSGGSRCVRQENPVVIVVSQEISNATRRQIFADQGVNLLRVDPLVTIRFVFAFSVIAY